MLAWATIESKWKKRKRLLLAQIDIARHAGQEWRAVQLQRIMDREWMNLRVKRADRDRRRARAAYRKQKEHITRKERTARNRVLLAEQETARQLRQRRLELLELSAEKDGFSTKLVRAERAAERERRKSGAGRRRTSDNGV